MNNNYLLSANPSAKIHNLTTKGCVSIFTVVELCQILDSSCGQVCVVKIRKKEKMVALQASTITYNINFFVCTLIVAVFGRGTLIAALSKAFVDRGGGH